MIIITTGDSRLYTADLFMPDGTTFAIDPLTDTVQVAIVSSDLQTRHTDPLAMVSTTPGADWDTSKVAFKFPREATADIVFPPRKKELSVVVEVQVTFDKDGLADDWTWRIEGVFLVKGNIS